MVVSRKQVDRVFGMHKQREVLGRSPSPSRSNFLRGFLYRLHELSIQLLRFFRKVGKREERFMDWIGPIAPNGPSIMNVLKLGVGAGYENEERVQIEQIILNVDLLR
jgi:hypothetical protein